MLSLSLHYQTKTLEIMAEFLTDKQKETLDAKDWNIIPKGAFITLYKHEFEVDVWRRYAEILGFDASKRVVKVLAIGTSK